MTSRGREGGKLGQHRTKIFPKHVRNLMLVLRLDQPLCGQPARHDRGCRQDLLTKARDQESDLKACQLFGDQLPGFFFGLRFGHERLGAQLGIPGFKILRRKLSDRCLAGGLAVGAGKPGLGTFHSVDRVPGHR
jgi:hypothetical protein